WQLIRWRLLRDRLGQHQPYAERSVNERWYRRLLVRLRRLTTAGSSVVSLACGRHHRVSPVGLRAILLEVTPDLHISDLFTGPSVAQLDEESRCHCPVQRLLSRPPLRPRSSAPRHPPSSSRRSQRRWEHSPS